VWQASFSNTPSDGLSDDASGSTQSGRARSISIAQYRTIIPTMQFVGFKPIYSGNTLFKQLYIDPKLQMTF